MAEFRNKPRAHRGDDSPTVEQAENGSMFDKVIELQATSSGPPTASRLTPRPGLYKSWQDLHRAAHNWLGPLLRWLFTPRIRGLILLNLVMLACASSFVVLKEGQADFDPFVFSSLRFVIAAAAFTPLLRGGALKDRNIVRGGIEIGIWSAGGYLTQSVGMMTSDASRGAFLNGLTVVVVPVCAGIAGSGVKRTTWVAVAVAMAGIYLLEGSGSPPSWGDFWNFASAVLFSLQIFRTEHYTKTYSARSGLAMMAVGLLVVAGISLLSMAWAFPLQTLYFLQYPTALLHMLGTSDLPWAAILYLGIGVTDGGLYAEVLALQDVTSVDAAFIYTLEPVAGAALAYVALGERWGPSGWVGAGLILCSNIITQYYGALEDKEHHHHPGEGEAEKE